MSELNDFIQTARDYYAGLLDGSVDSGLSQSDQDQLELLLNRYFRLLDRGRLDDTDAFEQLVRILDDYTLIKPTASMDAFTVGEDDGVVRLKPLGNDDANDWNFDGGLTIIKIDKGDFLGTAKITNDGQKIKIDLGDAYQYLNDGETEEVTIRYRIENAMGERDWGKITLTITGEGEPNTAPVTSPVDLGAIGEDSGATLITQAQLLVNATDADGDPLSASNLQISAGNGALTDNMDGTWSYTPATDDDSDVSFSYTVSDGTETVAGSASLDITPVDDPSTIGGDTTGSADETDAPVTITGTLTATDPDGPGPDNQFVAQSGTVGTYGTFDLAAGGAWSFTANAAFDALDPSISYTETFSVQAADGTAGSVSVTINGTEDPIVITGDTAGAVSEDGTLSDAGTLAATDADASDTPSFAAQSGTAGSYGSFDLAAGGGWSYTLDNAAAQSLAGGESVTETFTAVAMNADGGTASQNVTITVKGEEDPIVITGDTAGEVNEDGPLDEAGTLVATDADAGDTPTFVAQSGMAGSYGSFDLTAGGAWSYSLYNFVAQTLGAGETVTETFTAVAMNADGESANQTVTITVEGENDAPVAMDDILPGEGLTPLSGDFQVNTETSDTQQYSTVAALSDGGFVITWSSLEQDGSGWGIYGQRYDGAGMDVGGEFRINTTTGLHQIHSSVAPLSGGGFVVTWSSLLQDGSNYGIAGQRYDASGTPDGAEFLINSTTTDHQYGASVTGLAGGGFVVSWTSDGQDGPDSGTFGQIFDATGAAVGTEFQINTETNADQQLPSVASLPGGGFVVTWSSANQDGSGFGIYGQRYDAAGAKVGSEFPVNSTTSGDQIDSSVAGLDNGFVIVWASDGQDGSGTGIYGQRYDATGAAWGAEFQINTGTAGDQTDPTVAARPGGGFVVTWTSVGQDGSGDGVYSQMYYANGTPKGGEVRLNDITLGDQSADLPYGGTATAVLSNGVVVSTWTGQGSEEVFARLFDANATTDEDTAVTIDDLLMTLNDSDLDGDTLTITSTSALSALGAAVSVDMAGDVVYDPTGSAMLQALGAGETANDTFTYTISDGHGGTDSATVTLKVAGVNDAPVAMDDEIGTESFIPVGGDMQVNTGTSGAQFYPTIAALAGGGFVVTWSSFNQDGSGYGIYGQRYDASGAAQGTEFQVNTATADDQIYSSVAALAGGGFVVTWSSFGQDGSAYGIYGQRYDAGGSAVGTEFQVSTETFNNQQYSSVAALPDGGFVVTWTSIGQDGSNNGVYGQLYDAFGAAVGTEFLVNTTTAGDQRLSSVAALDGGGFVITWESGDQDGSGYGIVGQLYDAAGNTVGTEFVVNTETANDQRAPSAAALEGGGFVVTWKSLEQDGSSWGIYGQRYDAGGSAVGTEFQVSTETNSHQADASVAALNGGGFIVTWDSYDQDGSVYGVYGQLYDASGMATGDEFRLNSITAGHQASWLFYGGTGTVVLDDGTIVSAWAGLSSTEVFVRMFAPGLTDEDTAVTIDAADLLGNDSDVDGDALSIGSVSATSAMGAAVSIDAMGNVVYDPTGAAMLQALEEGETATDTFTYTAFDGTDSSAPVTVTLDVAGLNEAAVIGGTTVKTVNETNAPVSTGGTLTASDVDNPDNSFIAQSGVAGSYGTFDLTAGGVWTFVANSAFDSQGAGQILTDIFTVQSVDGTPATVTVNINGTNDPATFGGDQTASLTETDAVLNASGTLTNTDPDAVDNKFIAQTGTATTYGTFNLTVDGAWTYQTSTPLDNLAAGEMVTDSISVRSIDGTYSTVEITITGTNDAPIAVDDMLTVGKNSPTLVSPLANDIDADGDSLIISAFTQPSHGVVTDAGGGQLSYDPTNGYSGSDSFTYTISDGNGGFDTATFSLEVSN